MKNTMKKVLALLLAVLMMASLNVTVFAADDDFTGDSMSGTNDFYYTVTKEDVYTDISGVKLSWSVPVVKYTETNTLTWDTTNLMWVQTNPISTEGTEVSFTLTNRGSYAVKANVSYTSAVEGASSVTFGIKDPNGEDKTINTNDPTLDTIVNADHSLKVTKTEGQSDEDYAAARSEYVTNNCTATISGTVSIDDPSQLSAGSGKLGTYTVSIRKSGT